MKNSSVVRFLLPVILCLTVLLTGCVDYQVGINFATPYSGEITQHVKVSEKLSNLAPSDTKQWLDSLQKRSRQLDGNVKKLVCKSDRANLMAMLKNLILKNSSPT